MLGFGKRGFIVDNNIVLISQLIMENLHKPNLLEKMRFDGINWSRNFTLEKFEKQIQSFLITNININNE